MSNKTTISLILFTTTTCVFYPQNITEQVKQLVGVFNYYYYSLTMKSNLKYYHYIHNYSCLKTLAHRKKISISKITLYSIITRTGVGLQLYSVFFTLCSKLRKYDNISYQRVIKLRSRKNNEMLILQKIKKEWRRTVLNRKRITKILT